MNRHRVASTVSINLCAVWGGPIMPTQGADATRQSVRGLNLLLLGGPVTSTFGFPRAAGDRVQPLRELSQRSERTPFGGAALRSLRGRAPRPDGREWDRENAFTGLVVAGPAAMGTEIAYGRCTEMDSPLRKLTLGESLADE